MSIQKCLLSLTLLLSVFGCSASSNWSRPKFESGGTEARIAYFIPGTYTFPLVMSRSKHRTEGPPPGVKIVEGHREKDLKDWDELFTGFVTRDFEKRDKLTFEKVKAAPDAITLFGETGDIKSLEYLRNTIGVVQAALDAGGIAVYDMEGYRWYTPSEWKEKFFDPDKPKIQDQIYLLVNPNDDDPSLFYAHTQGMRKFGRADLALKNVREKEFPAIENFLFSNSDDQMRGKVIKDGAKLKIHELGKELTFKFIDGDNNPLFNNKYLEASVR
jgi:hypothetical protein